MIEKIEDYSKELNDDLTSKDSLLNGYNFTDTIDFDQTYEGVPGGSVSYNTPLFLKKTTYADTTAGYFLGLDGATPKFNLGDSTNYLKWTGTALNIAGTLTASSLDIPDTTTADSFHVDTSGNAWWGATAIGSAVAKVLKTGAATFTNIVLTGLQSGSSLDGQYLSAASVTGTAIANATITATNITNATITTTQISGTAAITGGQIASGTITSDNITNATITGGDIAAATITGSNIAATTIQAANIAAATITATEIANNTITAGQIAAATITTSEIAANTIVAGNIANNTITATEIANNTITAGQISNSTITTTQISGTAGIVGGQIASLTIAAGNIANLTITAAQIANSTITGGKIASDTITGAKLKIGNQSWSHDLAFSSTDLNTVAWASGTITMADGSTTYSIDAGNTGDMSARTYIYLDIATSITVLQTTTTAGTAVGDGKILIAVAQNSTTEATFQVFGGIGGIAIKGGDIENTSITASQMAADTITANQIAANTITAAEIAAATITTTEIAANTIVAGNIAAATITTTEIAANTIAAGNIAANTITAAEIAANTITAAEIAASTITATEMNVTQLSAITADLGTITTGSININSGMAGITSAGVATFKNYNLLQTYTAGETITAGKLLCLKHLPAMWYNDSTNSFINDSTGTPGRDVTTLFSDFVYDDPDNPATNYNGTETIYLGISPGIAHGYHDIYGKLDFANDPGLPKWYEVDRVCIGIYVSSLAEVVDYQTFTLAPVSAAFAEAALTTNNEPGIVANTPTSGANSDTLTLANEWTNQFTKATLDGSNQITGTGWVEFDITLLYRLWQLGTIDNNGFRIRTNGDSDAGRYRVSSNDHSTIAQRPYFVARCILNNPGSGATITVNNGKVYLSSDSDYNKVSQIVGVSGEAGNAGDTIDVYTLVNGALVPNSVLSVDVGRNYYLNDTSGTIGKLTQDIPVTNKYNLRIGKGTSDGLVIDFDNSSKFIKSESYYSGVGSLRPTSAKRVLANWISTNGLKGQIYLDRNQLNSLIQKGVYDGAGNMDTITVSWAAGTSGLLTSSGVLSATYYWYD